MHRRNAMRATLAILLTTVSGAALAQDKVKLTFLFDNAPSTVAMAEALATAFEAKHPNIDVETESRPGGAIHDPAADEAFRSELRSRLAPSVALVEIDAHINDPVFVRRACALLFEQLGVPIPDTH